MSTSTSRRLTAAGRKVADRLVAGGKAAGELRIGWVERVSLPGLGLVSLAAKMDTGARTSALHVSGTGGLIEAALREVSALEVTLPVPGLRRGRPVEVEVVEWVEVRDTSGRRERRPVIETVLELGPLRRLIRLTLTHRGDMRYPMLVGRTALAPGVLVDPTARFLLRSAPLARPRRERRER